MKWRYRECLNLCHLLWNTEGTRLSPWINTCNIKYNLHYGFVLFGLISKVCWKIIIIFKYSCFCVFVGFFCVWLLVLSGHSFLHPHHNSQWPPSMWIPIPDFIHYFFCPILIHGIEPEFPFYCRVPNKGTTGTIFIMSLVWRAPRLGIEPCREASTLPLGYQGGDQVQLSSANRTTLWTNNRLSL